MPISIKFWLEHVGFIDKTPFFEEWCLFEGGDHFDLSSKRCRAYQNAVLILGTAFTSTYQKSLDAIKE